MSRCQKQNNPPYFELTASPLSAEILWVSELLPGLLETREAVQLHLELASGPQPVSDTVMTSHMTQQASSLLTWLAAHWCPLFPAQSWFCHLSQISHPWVPWQFDTITTLFLHLPLWKRKPTSKETLSLFEMPSSSHYVPCLFDIYIWKKAHVSSKIRQQLSLHRKNLITLLLQSRHLYVQFMVNFAYFSGPSLASFV